MNKINNRLNGNRFIPVDSQEKTALELIKKVVEKSNEVIEQVNTFESEHKTIKETVKSFDEKVTQYNNEVLSYKQEVDKLPTINANAEVLDARCGKTTLGEFNRSISAQLEQIPKQYATKSEVGSPSTANSIEEMIDKAKVYVNTSDGNWYSWNGSNWVIGGVYNSVAISSDFLKKTTGEVNCTFIKQYDDSVISALDGGYNWISGNKTYKFTVKGATTANFNVKKVELGSQHGYAMFDINNTFIGGDVNISIDSSSLVSVNIPSNCEYIITTLENNVDPYGYLYFETNNIPYLNKEINNIKIEIDDKIKMTKNLFNENNIEISSNKYISDDGSLWDINGWDTTDFIKLNKGQYRVKFANGGAIAHNFRGYVYNSNKKGVSQIANDVFTIENDNMYVRFCSTFGFEKLMICLNSYDQSYEPYGTVAENSRLINSKWKGKKYCCIGDSITDGSNYPRWLAQETGMILIYDNGRAGTCVGYDDVMGGGEDRPHNQASMCTDVRVNLIPLETEVITILGGCNDWAGQGLTLGNIDSPHEHNTFYGAYQLMLDKIYARLPNVEIVLLEIIYRKDEETLATAEGKKMNDYRQAVRDIGYKYGLPVLKTYQNCGINNHNQNLYLADGVHPNLVGQRKIADVCISGMYSIK